jgi:hypothetical protein
MNLYKVIATAESNHNLVSNREVTIEAKVRASSKEEAQHITKKYLKKQRFEIINVKQFEHVTVKKKNIKKIKPDCKGKKAKVLSDETVAGRWLPR